MTPTSLIMRASTGRYVRRRSTCGARFGSAGAERTQACAMARRSVPSVLRRGPFAAGTALEHIGSGALRGPSYRRLLHGVYQAADLEVTHAVRIQAAPVAVGERAVLVGPSAAWALGSRLARPNQAAHVAVPGTGGAGQPLLVRHRATVPEDQVVATPFGRSTSADRTAVDLGRGTGTAGLTTGGGSPRSTGCSDGPA